MISLVVGGPCHGIGIECRGMKHVHPIYRRHSDYLAVAKGKAPSEPPYDSFTYRHVDAINPRTRKRQCLWVPAVLADHEIQRYVDQQLGEEKP